jgi:protein-tyrosine phosphatase
LRNFFHIALCFILVDFYARHTRGLRRRAIRIWFVLIGLSAVLTHQHHIVDVGGGLLPGAFSFYLFPESSDSFAPGPKNLRIASYYGVSAGAMFLLAWTTWPRGGLLLWPSIALAIVGVAYSGLGPAAYRKGSGLLPASAWLMLGPVLLGQRTSLLFYRRRCHPWNEVAPGLWIGRQLSNREASKAVRLGVRAVLDLTAEFSEAAPFRAMTYHNMRILDLTAPTLDQMSEAVDFIAREIVKGTVYVHCKIGSSRSAAVVGAYLLATRRAGTTEEALECLRTGRPSIIVRPEVVTALFLFDRNTKRATSVLS